jgi:uncharacterized protein with von Willebrand factor type A (vWA) domain
MDERIVKFISALRSAGVRVSLAESADAFSAVDELGVMDRDTFRLSLRSTLVKDARNLPVFEELFPLFFGNAGAPPLMNLSEDLTPDEAQKLAEALRQFSDQIRQMLERLMRGEQLSPEELDRLGKFVGLNQIDDLRYREWMSQRLQKALRFPEVREALRELAELLAQMGMDKQRVDQMMRLMQSNQQALEDQLRQFAGQRIAENLSEQRPDDNIDALLNRPFSALSDKDMEKLRKQVQRLATILRTRVALRQKRAKSGQLDAKNTIRANLKHGSVPIEIKHRERTLKPKLVVVCDVSTSMRSCSELMLSLLYALQDQISKTHAFAFIDHLEYISPAFEGNEARQAVSQVLERMPSGYYNTDFGNSLEDFNQDYLDTMDGRTTFLVVGDGRNNYNDPRVDIFSLLARRSRRTIWITPEASGLWGTGDSDMLKYAPNCDVILQAGNLAELTAAVDKLLSHSA